MEMLHDCEGRLACKGNPATGLVECLYKGNKTSTHLAIGEKFTIECQGVITNVIRTCTGYFTVESHKMVAVRYAELVDSVDEDLASMQKQIEDLTKQNEALTAEVQGRRAKMDAMSSVPLLCFGGEDDLFSDEIKEFVLGALQHELDGTEGGTRKADVLGDVIRANGGFKDASRGKAERLKNALRGYKNLSNKQKRVLEELGFTLTLDGDHYKAVYWKDERYMATLACTPSDHRDGMNIALEIIKDML